MQSIQTQVIQIYQDNLNFLSQNYPEVFQKIQTFNSALENATLLAQYDLEYLDGYFDVKQIASQNYLYSDNSIAISSALTKQVNNNKNSFSFEGFPLYYNIEKAKDMDDKTLGLEGVYPMMSYYIDTIERSSKMKKIEKFIFIGVGLGMHLFDIHKKILANEYLIIEDDLELFNLSLFCTKYYEIGSDAKFYFSIAEDENSFMNIINTFLEDSFYLNRYLKYSYFPAHSESKIKFIQNALISQDFISFPYKTLLRKYLKPLEYINEDYKIINFMHHFTSSRFSDKPMLVLGAGPSLQKNIKWLEKNHNSFILMAVSSTLKTIHKYNIKPDIITHMDGFESVLDIYKGFDVKEFTKDSIILFGSFIPTQVREMFSKENIFFTEEDTYYFKDYNSLVGPCIGSTSLLYALMLDIKEIYTLGTDFAVDEVTGKTHSDGHITKDRVDISTKDTLKEQMSFRKNLFAVNGNFTAKVYTNSLYQVSIQALHNRIPLIKKEYQKIYNLNNGAKINETVPLHVENIKSYKEIDKKQLFDEIKTTMEQESSTVLTQNDIASLQERLVFVKKIKETLQRYKKEISYANDEKYLYNLLGLTSDLLRVQERETNNLVKIYYMFFKYTLPLIMDVLNTQGLKNTKKHIKSLDKLLIQELLNIQEIYEQEIEKFLKKCSL